MGERNEVARLPPLSSPPAAALVEARVVGPWVRTPESWDTGGV